MASELYVFVLVRVIVNAPLVRASLVRITRTGTRNRTRVNMNAAWVGTIFLFFAVCGPKYTRLCHSVRETLQFATLFSNLWYLVASWKYLQLIKSPKWQNWNLSFLALNFYGEGPPNFETKIFTCIPGHTTWIMLLWFCHRPQWHKPKYTKFLANFWILMCQKLLGEDPSYLIAMSWSADIVMRDRKFTCENMLRWICCFLHPMSLSMLHVRLESSSLSCHSCITRCSFTVFTPVTNLKCVKMSVVVT